jgi:putative inorganic carbon (HCO3(-)) transporter
VIAVIAALALIPGLRDSVSSRAGNQRSIYDRQNTNAAALRIVDRFPLEGVGWVRFRLVSDEYVRQAPDYPITNIKIEVHNVPLGRAAELGLPGALVWLGSLVLGPIAAAWRSRGLSDELRGWRLLLIGTLTGWGAAAMLTPLPYALPNLLIWLLAGIVAAPRLLASTAEAP